MTTAKTFDTWLAQQASHGLVALRLSVIQKPGVNPIFLQQELLAAEFSLESGKGKAAPRATSSIPASILRLIECTTAPVLGVPAPAHP
jgi:hypothetical protein